MVLPENTQQNNEIDYSIEHPTVEDAGELSKFFSKQLTAFKNNWKISNEVCKTHSGWYSEELLSGKINKIGTDREFIVAKDKETWDIVGAIDWMYKTHKNIFQINRFFVNKEQQNNTIWKNLLSKLIETVKSSTVENIDWILTNIWVDNVSCHNAHDFNNFAPHNPQTDYQWQNPYWTWERWVWRRYDIE